MVYGLGGGLAFVLYCISSGFTNDEKVLFKTLTGCLSILFELVFLGGCVGVVVFDESKSLAVWVQSCVECGNFVLEVLKCCSCLMCTIQGRMITKCRTL